MGDETDERQREEHRGGGPPQGADPELGRVRETRGTTDADLGGDRDGMPPGTGEGGPPPPPREYGED